MLLCCILALVKNMPTESLSQGDLQVVELKRSSYFVCQGVQRDSIEKELGPANFTGKCVHSDAVCYDLDENGEVGFIVFVPGSN